DEEKEADDAEAGCSINDIYGCCRMCHGDNDATQRRPDNRGKLPGAAGPCRGASEMLHWHKLWDQSRACGVVKRQPNADKEEAEIDQGEWAMRMRECHEAQRAERQQHLGGEHDAPTVEPVG